MRINKSLCFNLAFIASAIMVVSMGVSYVGAKEHTPQHQHVEISRGK